MLFLVATVISGQAVLPQSNTSDMSLIALAALAALLTLVAITIG